MPASAVHRLVLTLGFLSLFHAAYSAAQHRSYLRLNELKFDGLPLDITLQAVGSLLAVMYGVLQIAGDFKEIKASAELENKTWETFRNVVSFYTFNHRGKSFSPDYRPMASKSSLDEAD